MNDQDRTYFFDTNGDLWATCDADEYGADAFGPTGCARRIYVQTNPGMTPWSEAECMGVLVRAEHGDEFDTLRFGFDSLDYPPDHGDPWISNMALMHHEQPHADETQT